MPGCSVLCSACSGAFDISCLGFSRRAIWACSVPIIQKIQPEPTNRLFLFKSRFLFCNYTTHPKGQRLTPQCPLAICSDSEAVDLLIVQLIATLRWLVLHHVTALSISPLFSVHIILVKAACLCHTFHHLSISTTHSGQTWMNSAV